MAAILQLPDKLFFRIGEVSRLLGVQPHVLRYWESEFPSIRPPKSRTNQRLYRPADIERLAMVKELLYDEGYTIAGARKRLAAPRRESHQEPPADSGLPTEPPERINVPAPPADKADRERLESRCRELEAALEKTRKAAQGDKAALQHRLRKGLEAIRDLARNQKSWKNGA